MRSRPGRAEILGDSVDHFHHDAEVLVPDSIGTAPAATSRPNLGPKIIGLLEESQ